MKTSFNKVSEVDGLKVLAEFSETLPNREVQRFIIESKDHEQLEGGLRFLQEQDFEALSIKPFNGKLQNTRLAVFDGDMTLWQCEVIDELGKRLGVFGEISQITERAMNGELDFRKALIERVKLLKGLNDSVFEELYEDFPLTNGAKECFHLLKSQGIKTVIVSGGFIQIVKKVADFLGADYCFANNLESQDGALTGNLSGDIVDSQFKKNTLESVANEIGVPREFSIAVGDGANDLEMLRIAGFGIAFRAKELVKRETSSHINCLDLRLVNNVCGLN